MYWRNPDSFQKALGDEVVSQNERVRVRCVRCDMYVKTAFPVRRDGDDEVAVNRWEVLVGGAVEGAHKVNLSFGLGAVMNAPGKNPSSLTNDAGPKFLHRPLNSFQCIDVGLAFGMDCRIVVLEVRAVQQHFLCESGKGFVHRTDEARFVLVYTHRRYGMRVLCAIQTTSACGGRRVWHLGQKTVERGQCEEPSSKLGVGIYRSFRQSKWDNAHMLLSSEEH